MEYYSNNKPNLIASPMKKTVFKIVSKKSTNNTISEKISKISYSIYKNYIKEHLIVILILLFVAIFLTYRYYTNKANKIDKFSTEDYRILKDIKDEQTSHLRYDTQPSFDRLQSVKDQEETVYYPPDALPINIPNKGIVYSRNIYDDPDPFPYLNTPSYDYDNVYKNKTRSYYNGTYNTYGNASDTDIINPLGFSNNFNTTTGEFVGGMTKANDEIITDYQTILDNTNGNLIDSLRIGPKYMNESSFATMEPPYAMQ